METYVLFFVASIAAGAINPLASGGGLITIPLLMLVAAPVTADATSAVALLSAYPTAVWRTRSQLTGVLGHRWLWLLLIPSLLGGLLGALLLSRTGDRNFVSSCRGWLYWQLSSFSCGRFIGIGFGVAAYYFWSYTAQRSCA